LAYVVAAAQGGYHANGRETYGNSMIVDPWTVLARIPQGTGCISYPLERDFQVLVRRSFPAIGTSPFASINGIRLDLSYDLAPSFPRLQWKLIKSDPRIH